LNISHLDIAILEGDKHLHFFFQVFTSTEAV